MQKVPCERNSSQFEATPLKLYMCFTCGLRICMCPRNLEKVIIYFTIFFFHIF